MQILLKKIAIAMVAALLFLSLTACNKNPLLSKENINMIHFDYFVDDDARQCSTYYANPAEQTALKSRCDKWSEECYKALINRGDISYKATLENFRDPELWKILKPK